MTCYKSPGRGPKVRRFSACTARFGSLGLEAAFSFFLASTCGTIHGRLKQKRIVTNFTRPKRMRTPEERRQTLLIINPDGTKRLLAVVPKKLGGRGVRSQMAKLRADKLTAESAEAKSNTSSL